jgi:GT2 family glycosyltransferase
VVIASRNRQCELVNTIKSYLSSFYLPYEIIIVDQSDDYQLTKKFINDINTAVNLKLIHLNRPSSTKARNVGIELSKNELIIFSDDDILVESNTIYNLYNIFSNEKQIGMIAGININDIIRKKKLTSIYGYILGKKYLINNRGYITKSMYGRYPDNIENRIETEWAMGYFFCVKKTILVKYKIKWDENLVSYAYAEDLDFSHRYYLACIKENLECILDPKVRVYHLASPIGRISNYKGVLMGIIHREYLSYKLNNSAISSIATRWSNFGEVLIHIITFKNPLLFIKAYFCCIINRRQLKDGIIPNSIKEYFQNN